MYRSLQTFLYDIGHLYAIIRPIALPGGNQIKHYPETQRVL